ncbi:MAG: ribonuclease HII [Magnetococcales bacterium]|nr:ribonuclease HII [Magnetococcales bacterium]
MPRPDFHMEEDLCRSGHRFVGGIDEVGRGPLAGPVMAAAVILSPSAVPDGLDDSKRLTPGLRESLVREILARAVAVGIGMASVDEIDRLNIRQAALLAMTRAVARLRRATSAGSSRAKGVAVVSAPDDPLSPGSLSPDRFLPDFLLVDGRDVPPGLPCPARAVIKGDTLSASIAAASILAKVTRDAIMDELARIHPGYGWERNKGYPTREHVAALQSLGIAPHHRRTFGPVRRVMNAAE